MCLNKGEWIYSFLGDTVGKEAPESVSCRAERKTCKNWFIPGY